MYIIKRLIIIFYFLICGFFLAVPFVVRFVFDNWGELMPDEIIYHLITPLTGTDDSLIQKGLGTSGILIIILFFVLMAFNFIVYKTGQNYGKMVSFSLCLCVFMTIASLYDANSRSGIVTYLSQVVKGELFGNFSIDAHEDFITANYVDPMTVETVAPKKKKNLIYLYLESFEITFSDIESGGAFKENVIPEVTDIILENQCFNGEESILNGAYSLPGTNWTAAGIFSEMSGLPIKLSIVDNYFMEEDSFLPQISTIGDILLDAGYENTIMIGSDIEFGGRNYLFSEHGNFKVHDYNYARNEGLIPPDYKVFWGYEDKRLFAHAKDDLEKLSEGDKPFYYAMLTADTHHPEGYFCENCKNDFGEDKYSNVYACSSRQIKDFVTWFKESKFYEDTVLVIAGDHLTMNVNYCSDIDEEYNRRVAYCIINSDTETKGEKYREYSVFDMFPTTLAALGYEIPGNRLGMGTNLYSNFPTLIETFGYETVKLYLEKPSNFYKNMGKDLSIVDLTENIRDRVKTAYRDDEGKLMIILHDVQFFDPAFIEDIHIRVYNYKTKTEKNYDLEINDHERNKDRVGFFYVKTDIDVQDAKEDLSLGLKAYITYDGNDEVMFFDKVDKVKIKNE